MSRQKEIKTNTKRSNKRNTLEHTSSIPKSFLLPHVITKSQIRKEYRRQIGHDESHRLNAGGWWHICDVNPMFTSRNSHKQTNKK